jgi:hypothetical protein
MIEHFARILADNCRKEGVMETHVPRVDILRRVTPTETAPVLRKPAVCFVAQGRKQTT